MESNDVYESRTIGKGLEVAQASTHKPNKPSWLQQAREQTLSDQQEEQAGNTEPTYAQNSSKSRSAGMTSAQRRGEQQVHMHNEK